MALALDAIFINGTVGAGKTTVAHAISAMEPGPHAVIDLDGIRTFGPSSEEDPFNHELELANLKSLSDNYRKAGATRFVLAGVIEEAPEIPRYISALGSRGLFICRLTANETLFAIDSRGDIRGNRTNSPGTLRARLSSLAPWMSKRSTTLSSTHLNGLPLILQLKSEAQPGGHKRRLLECHRQRTPEIRGISRTSAPAAPFNPLRRQGRRFESAWGTTRKSLVPVVVGLAQGVVWHPI